MRFYTFFSVLILLGTPVTAEERVTQTGASELSLNMWVNLSGTDMAKPDLSKFDEVGSVPVPLIRGELYPHFSPSALLDVSDLQTLGEQIVLWNFEGAMVVPEDGPFLLTLIRHDVGCSVEFSVEENIYKAFEHHYSRHERNLKDPFTIKIEGTSAGALLPFNYKMYCGKRKLAQHNMNWFALEAFFTNSGKKHSLADFRVSG